MRTLQLLQQGTVCEDIKALTDPAIQTVAQARDVRQTRCPVFDRCIHRDEFIGGKGLNCIPRSAQEVARYSALPGGSLDEEMKDFAKEAPIERLNGYFDPYSEGGVDEIITDPDEILDRIHDWAEVLRGEGEATSEPVIGQERDFLTLVATARTPEGGIDLTKIDAATPVGENGGVPCDVTRGPCSCGAWH
jgi:hypothetical protein